VGEGEDKDCVLKWISSLGLILKGSEIRAPELADRQSGAVAPAVRRSARALAEDGLLAVPVGVSYTDNSSTDR